MGDKWYHTLVNPNQMYNNHIDVQDNHCMQNPMGITCPKYDVTIPLNMSGTIVSADNLLPKQHQFRDFPQMILTYLLEWDPHCIRFLKDSHSEEEIYSLSGIAEIRVDALRSKVHETEIDPGLRNTIHDLSFIAAILVSQVRIADAKVPDATRINDLDKDVFEGPRQDVPSHRIFMPKEIYLDVNPSDFSERWKIGIGSAYKTLKATTQRMLRLAIMPISRQYRYDCMFGCPRIKGGIYLQTQWQGGISPLAATTMHKYLPTITSSLLHTPSRKILYQGRD